MWIMNYDVNFNPDLFKKICKTTLLIATLIALKKIYLNFLGLEDFFENYLSTI